jgi:hypothetical protein
MEEKHTTIITCLRETSAQVIQTRLDSLSTEAWQALLETTGDMGITLLMFCRLDRMKVALPPEIRAKLLAKLRENTGRNLFLLKSFDQITTALSEQDIPVLLLKGVFLAVSLYDNIGERVMGDMDILVHPQHLTKTVELIEALGYHTRAPYDLDFEIKNHHHLPAFFLQDLLMLEIHWRLLQIGENDAERNSIWQRAVSVKMGGITVYGLAPEDMLTYLCAHIAYHHLYENAIRSLYDIKLLVEKNAGHIDWAVVAQRGREWGVFKALYLTLRITDELTGCPLPQNAWDELRPADFDENLVQAGCEKIFARVNQPGWLSIWTQKSALERFQSALRGVFLPASVLARKYNLPVGSKRVYLYYPVRFYYLAIKYAGELLNLVKPDRQKGITRDGDLMDYLGYQVHLTW